MQPPRPTDFHPFEVDRWVISWFRGALPCSGGAIWSMLTKWMQVGSFHSWINMWVAGKTVWSLCAKCHSREIVAPLVTWGINVGSTAFHAFHFRFPLLVLFEYSRTGQGTRSSTSVVNYSIAAALPNGFKNISKIYSLCYSYSSNIYFLLH